MLPGKCPRKALLLQEAVESYVYSVLGSQARTRFKIVGAGAKSLQTQQIFHTIVKETVAQDDDSVLIANIYAKGNSEHKCCPRYDYYSGGRFGA